MSAYGVLLLCVHIMLKKKKKCYCLLKTFKQPQAIEKMTEWDEKSTLTSVEGGEMHFTIQDNSLVVNSLLLYFSSAVLECEVVSNYSQQ